MKIALNKTYTALLIIAILYGGWKEISSRNIKEENKNLNKKLQEVHQTATTITNYNNFYMLPEEVKSASRAIVAVSGNTADFKK